KTTSPPLEAILIGRETYTKVNGAWRKVAMDLRGSMDNMRDTFNEQALKNIHDVAYAGEDVVDGKDAFVYTFKGKAQGALPAYTSKLWVGKNNGLPLKNTVEYSSSGRPQSSVTTYTYKTDVTINAPI